MFFKRLCCCLVVACSFTPVNRSILSAQSNTHEHVINNISIYQTQSQIMLLMDLSDYDLEKSGSGSTTKHLGSAVLTFDQDGVIKWAATEQFTGNINLRSIRAIAQRMAKIAG